MKKIQINFLVHNPRRKPFAEITKYYLKRIKAKNKAKILFLIHTSYDKTYWENFAFELLDSGIDSSTIFYPNKMNYMDKILTAAKSPLPYSISLDEDVIMGNPAWDNFISDTEIFELNKDTLFVSPLASIEVGTIRYFLNTLFRKDTVNKIEKMYLKADFTEVGNAWGVDYSSLTKYIKETSKFNSIDFYSLVDKLDTYYKGIHPVRVLPEVQMEIAKEIINHYDDFINMKVLRFPIAIETPYFTNHCYMIPTNLWGRVLRKQDLFVDDFDEVPLNRFRKINKLKAVFDLGALAIHGSYNTIGGEHQKQIEDILIRGIYGTHCT